jgi:hypothetical protein
MENRMMKWADARSSPVRGFDFPLDNSKVKYPYGILNFEL